MRKVRVLLAAALVAVFVLGALNVSVAGQRDHLRQKVRALNERLTTLEEHTTVIEKEFDVRTNKLFSHMAWTHAIAVVARQETAALESDLIALEKRVEALEP